MGGGEVRNRMFMRQFEPAITRKVKPKRQTVRPFPKRMPRVGEIESWRVWTDKPYRSKQRELVKVVLTGVETVRISPEVISNLDIDSRRLFYDTETFARNDGFNDWQAMRDWFEKQHGLPFEGILITAKDAGDAK
jgi:hypothetical protein